MMRALPSRGGFEVVAEIPEIGAVPGDVVLVRPNLDRCCVVIRNLPRSEARHILRGGRAVLRRSEPPIPHPAALRSLRSAMCPPQSGGLRVVE